MPSHTNNNQGADNNRVVFRTGLGRIKYCTTCGRSEDQCRCRNRRGRSSGPTTQVPRDGIVRLLRDRAGRKGKPVTAIVGLPDDPQLLEELARTLKKLCGVGGTVRGDVIELQGDVREMIRPKLERLGYTVKIAGG